MKICSTRRFAAILIASCATRAVALPVFSNFQAQACLGNAGATNYVYLSGDDQTVYTASPELLIQIAAVSGPPLNENVFCLPGVNETGPCGTKPVPAQLPQISTAVAGLQGAWEFEGNGNDSSLAGDNLTFVPSGCDSGHYASANTSVYPTNNAWTPNGSACKATAANNFSFGSGNFSVDVWVNVAPSVHGSYWPIMASCSGAQSACLELALAPPTGGGNTLSPFFGFGGSGNSIYAGGNCTNSTVNDNLWHHLAFVYNNPQQEIFIDGIPCGVNTATMTATGSTIYVGSNGSGFGLSNGTYADGSITALRLYNQIFSDGTYALHARGSIFRINGDESYNGEYSDTGSAEIQASPWSWDIPSTTARVFTSTAPNTVEFAEEDLGENIAFQDYTVNVNQTQLSTPTPSISLSTGDPEHSLTYDMGSYVCDTSQTKYSLTLSTGGILTVPQGPLSLTMTGLTPNTKYGFQASAVYTDTGGSGAVVPSGQSGVVSVYTYANAPGKPIVTQTGGTSASVVLSTDAGTPWNNAGSTNPAGTDINVEYSTNAGTSYLIGLNYTPSNSGPQTMTGLPKSSSLIFHSHASNIAGVISSSGPATTALFVTEPNTPTNFAGTPSTWTAVGYCGKTAIHWSWTGVTQGSNGLGASYLMGRSGGGAANAYCAGTLSATTTSCDEGGFTPGEQVTDVVQASDTAVGLPFPLGAAATATAQTASASNPSVTNASGTSLTDGILWTWTAPPYLCAPSTYSIYNSSTGVLLTQLNAANGPAWTETLGPNALSEIRISAQDPYDSVGILSSTVAAYSQADVPVNMTATSVSSGSLLVSWGANGNPSYTRYEISTSLNGVSYTIVKPISADDTQTSYAAGSLSPGTSYYFEVRAFNGGGAAGIGTTFTNYLTGAFMTVSTEPYLSASTDAANPTTAIDWSWQDVGGVSRYDLIVATTGFVIGSVYPPYSGTVHYTQTGLTPNAPAEDAVVAYNGQGLASTSAAVTFFTESLPPGAAAGSVVAVASNTITYAWTAGANPADTIYQVNVSTDPAFSIVIATEDFTTVIGTVTGLFPLTTYYAQVRSVSGSGYPSASLSLGSAATAADSHIIVSTSPASIYAVGAGVVGLWHFDESTGTTALDSSGYGNSGALLCAPGPCTSTPTYVAGRPGMGTALSFNGSVGGIVSIADAPQYDSLSSSITISAWVLPGSANMSINAGIVVKGSQGAEDWFLEVVSGHYEFGVTTTGGRVTVLSNAAATVGQWTSLIGVFDAQASQLRLYVNGALDNSPVAAAARTTSSHAVSIGAGQSSSGGSYNQPFTGDIDEVQLSAMAFTSQQALAYYQSASASTVTFSGTGGVYISLPPNAFPAPAVIYTTQDPINHPLTVNPASLQAGLLDLPTGQALIPNSLVEIVPVVNGEPFTSLLGSSATIGLPFSASGGVVNGMSPPVAASSLSVYTFNPTVMSWTSLPTVVDQQSGLATAQTPHFSVFALLGATSISGAASSARVYPDPWKQGSGGRFDAPALTIADLPESGSVRILTLDGLEVIELSFNGSDSGTLTWNGRNAAGRPVASGVYFAYVKPSSGSSNVIKFAIER